ncbi:hypothetical protein [Saccharothrix yanglingensis]|uniref:Uncharacterized protein n=1 Tax=Saccharothrix yanglingensis TaxID=659496 RepID=A0ABU0X2S4_9PSEU|nr:hypothetical protein [Saccharothrix yanglingensis]MDQ2586434.1 hypothetical protein [Saccharothrix yanglingensis]
MTKAQKIAAAWSVLPAADLSDEVKHLVQTRDAGARAIWAAVREDAVLAARVRGSLAGLKAEYRGHRDEAMWLLWVNQVQQQLAVPATEPAPAAVPPRDEARDDEPTAEISLPAPAAPRRAVAAPALLFQEPLSS